MTYRVDEIAAHTGLSIDTIRYYQKLGLVDPPRREGRMAVYDDLHRERLEHIKTLSNDGFSLSQIKRLNTDRLDPRLVALADGASTSLGLDDLVERSGLDADLVRLAVDAGLIAPIEGEPGRFGPDAETMLGAAATILESGLPVDELAALALRHADQVEQVVDDAIDIFRRHLPGADAAAQARTVESLIPAVSDLVSLHFKRTLLDKASARVVAELGEPAEPPQLFCEWSEVDEPVDLVSVGHFVRDDHRFLWLQPGGGEGIIAWGHAASWTPASGGAASAFVGSTKELLTDTPVPPVFVGGFAFDPETTTTLPWSSFGPGRLIFPSTQLIRRGGRLVLMAFAHDRDQAKIRHDHALTMVEAAEHRGVLELEPVDLDINDTTGDHYLDIVAEAVADISDDHFDKVVLARSIELNANVPLGAWLAALRERFPSCAIFARGEGSRTFFGATPEVLVRVDGTQVRTAAVAGTRPRGEDPVTDADLAGQLLSSSKEIHEHTLVVESIVDRLATAGVTVDDLPPVSVLKLPGIQHLHTPITGVRPPTTDILRLVEQLHPTPAVGGKPRDVALEWIREHENLDRGWYAAPIGWTDTEGSGEFRVGLRSALHGPERTILFAGCGIVGGSEPDDELVETHTKFGALLDVLRSSPGASGVAL